VAHAPAPEAADQPVEATAGPLAAGPGQIEMHFLNVGQGDSTLVKCPNGESILIDCGSTGGFDKAAVRQYLRAQLDAAAPAIDLLVISHPDRDHYNKVESVLQAETGQPQIAVARVAYVGDIAAYDQADFDAWLTSHPSKENLADSDYNVFPTRSLDVCGDEVLVSVLAANVQSSFSSSNTASIVLLIAYGTFDVLVTGDSTRITQYDILNRFAGNLHVLNRVEVLRVEHHGSRTTSTLDDNSRTDWFDAVSPEVAVFSASATNSYGHPSRQVADALDEYTLPADDHPLLLFDGPSQPSTQAATEPFRTEAIFSTATNGNIVVRSDGAQYTWSWGE
jgi:beta-lactamase superfamily II metal-dependent hydrolase